MIGKAIIGNSFYGCVNYCLQSIKRPIIMGQNGVFGSNPLSLSHQFELISNLKRNVSKPVCHSAISFAHKDKINDALIQAIVKDYLKDIGLDQKQYLLIKHQDTKHEHVHLIINRIGFDGEVARDYRSGYRTKLIMQKLEKKYGLIVAQKQGNKRKEQIRLLIETGLQKRKDLKTILNDIEQIGYKVIFNKTSNDKIIGMSFLNIEKGITFKSSEISRKYSYNKLLKATQTRVNSIKRKKTIDLER
jgi:hypothetical protein